MSYWPLIPFPSPEATTVGKWCLNCSHVLWTCLCTHVHVCGSFMFLMSVTDFDRNSLKEKGIVLAQGLLSSDTLPPPRLHLLKVPPPPKTAPSTREQMFKDVSLWGSFHTLTIATRCFPFPPQQGPTGALSYVSFWRYCIHWDTCKSNFLWSLEPNRVKSNH